MRVSTLFVTLLALLAAGSLLLFQGEGEVAAQGGAGWEPLIAIVWPHDGNGNPVPVTRAREVNISVWPRNQVSCLDKPANISLYQTWQNEPAVRVRADGQMVLRTVEGVTFPTLEFNDVPVETAQDSGMKHRFYIDLGGKLSNVWVHAADARTIQPLPVAPDGYAVGNPDLDPSVAWIQIVFPHDASGVFAPVERATFVNVAFDLFELNRSGARLSAPLNYAPNPRLLVAYGNGPLQETSLATVRSTYRHGGNEYPRWVFNDLSVRPGQQAHLLITNTGRGGTSSIWTHAVDARTLLPLPSIPPPCIGPAATPTVTTAPPTATSTLGPTGTATTTATATATATVTVDPYPGP